MMFIDLKVGKAILALTHDYDKKIFYKFGTTHFHMEHYAGQSTDTVSVDLPAQDIRQSIERLNRAGKIIITNSFKFLQV